MSSEESSQSEEIVKIYTSYAKFVEEGIKMESGKKYKIIIKQEDFHFSE